MNALRRRQVASFLTANPERYNFGAIPLLRLKALLKALSDSYPSDSRQIGQRARALAQSFLRQPPVDSKKGGQSLDQQAGARSIDGHVSAEGQEVISLIDMG